MTAPALVVVGVDGSDSSFAALGLGLREAALRETHVLAVTCWPVIVSRRGLEPTLFATRARAIGLLEDVIAEVRLRERHSALVLRQVDDDLPGPTLVAASRGAGLVVVGASCGSGRTVRHCLLHAEAPVVVVPRPTAAKGPSQVLPVPGCVRLPAPGTSPWTTNERRSEELP